MNIQATCSSFVSIREHFQPKGDVDPKQITFVAMTALALLSVTLLISGVIFGYPDYLLALSGCGLILAVVVAGYLHVTRPPRLPENLIPGGSRPITEQSINRVGQVLKGLKGTSVEGDLQEASLEAWYEGSFEQIFSPVFAVNGNYEPLMYSNFPNEGEFEYRVWQEGNFYAMEFELTWNSPKSWEIGEGYRLEGSGFSGKWLPLEDAVGYYHINDWLLYLIDPEGERYAVESMILYKTEEEGAYFYFGVEQLEDCYPVRFFV